MLSLQKFYNNFITNLEWKVFFFFFFAINDKLLLMNKKIMSVEYTTI